MALHDASHRHAYGGSVPAQYAFMIYLSHIITFIVSFYEGKQTEGNAMCAMKMLQQL